MKNQKIKTTFILLALFAGVFQGCKKGENDPFISLHTRDARLAGDWDLSGKNSETTTTSVNGGNTSVTKSTSTYSDGIETTVSVGGTSSTKYNLKLKIEKNGQFTYTLENFNSKGEPSSTNEYKGYWTWGSTAKRKSSIIIDVDGPMKDILGGVWNIDQLKNKEIIFKKTDYSKNSSTNFSTEINTEATMTFTGK